MKLALWVAAAIGAALLLWALGTAVMWECAESGWDCMFSEHSLIYRYQNLLSGIFALLAAILVFSQGRQQVDIARKALEHEQRMHDEDLQRRDQATALSAAENLRICQDIIKDARAKVTQYKEELGARSLRAQIAQQAAIDFALLIRPYNLDLANWIVERINAASYFVAAPPTNLYPQGYFQLELAEKVLDSVEPVADQFGARIPKLDGREAIESWSLMEGVDPVTLGLRLVFN